MTSLDQQRAIMVIKMETKNFTIENVHAVADCDSISEHQLEQDHNEKVSPKHVQALVKQYGFKKEVATDMLQHFFLPDEEDFNAQNVYARTYEHYVSDQQVGDKTPFNIEHFSKTRAGAATFAALTLGLAYGCFCLAVDRGNFLWYALTLVLGVAGLQYVFRAAGILLRRKKV